MTTQADRIQKKMRDALPIREGGGVYVYRTRKPMSIIGREEWPAWATMPAGAVLGAAGAFLLGMPWWVGLALAFFATGRHFGYVGETVSFRDRHGEHINGGGRWGKRAQPWADLDPKCVVRIPLPRWKPLLRWVESLLIFFLMPVYNDKGNRWNPRRIPLGSAKRQELARRRRKSRLSFNFRSAHLIALILLVLMIGL